MVNISTAKFVSANMNEVVDMVFIVITPVKLISSVVEIEKPY